MKVVDAERKQIEILSKMSGQKRVQIGAELCEMGRKMVITSLRNQSLTDQELDIKAGQRFLPKDLWQKVRIHLKQNEEMIQEEVIVFITKTLDHLNILYMITGSIACNYYGKPRFTHDVDLIIEIDERKVESLASALEDRFYLDRDMIREAIYNRSQFSSIHLDSGFKVGFWLVKRESFDEMRFQRRRSYHIFGRDVCLSTAEDLILIELVWYRDSKSDKHYEDARGIYQIQADQLDKVYLKHWAETLGIDNLLEKLDRE